jgi:hypothetical protein
MTPSGVSCQHQMVTRFRSMQKSRMRWDYKRGAWRHLGGDSGRWPLRCWYKPCGVCGKMTDFLGPGRTKCFACRRKHWRQLDSISHPAQYLVAKAIKAGVLPKLDGSVPCVDCGEPARVYDHREYARPLDVEPVCKGCNNRRGPAKETAPLVEAYARRGRRP